MSYTRAFIHEKIFNADLCTKGCPWVTQKQKQKILKDFRFAFAAKMGVIHQALLEGGNYSRDGELLLRVAYFAKSLRFFIQVGISHGDAYTELASCNNV